MRRESRYSTGEIEGLLEEFDGLWPIADTSPQRLRLLIRLIDVRRALDRLDPVHRRVVLATVIFGPAEASRRLDLAPSTVFARYRWALERMTAYLNGGES